MWHSLGQKFNAGPQLSETSPSKESEDNLPFRDDICGPVAATLNEDMFNIVISRWRETYEDLKQTKDYKTLSAAGSLMKNMVSKYVCHTFRKTGILYLVFV
jgi:timeless